MQKRGRSKLEVHVGYLVVVEEVSWPTSLSAAQDTQCNLNFILHYVIFIDKTRTKMSLKQNTGANMGSLLKEKRIKLSRQGLGLSQRMRLPSPPFSHQ